MFEAGARVRLKNDPAVVGVIADRLPEVRAGRTFFQVELPTGRRSLPANQLEPVAAAPDALVDLRDGKLSAPADLRRALTHLRMTGRLADMIYSMGATNTEFHAYQFKPVLKLLNSPSRGLLIADEVGLGKTIEAGLIWTELVARNHDCRRLLVVCPKPLVEKWRAELRNKFNVDARICGASELLDTLRDDQERREGFQVIASLSAIRPPRGWDDPDEPAPGARADLARWLNDSAQDLFDLAIFDEAHHLRNVETMNHKLAKLVADVSDYALFLSATPINLRANDLRALLKLIDPDTFEREYLFDLLQEENIPLVRAWEAARDTRVSMHDLAQLVADLPEGRVLKTGERLKRLRDEFEAGIVDTPANRVKLAARIEEMSLLGSTINRTRRRDVAEFKVERRPQTVKWPMTEAEEAFYRRATQRIEAYAYANDINERFLLAQTQRLLASSLPTAYRHWGERSGFLTLDEEGDSEGALPGPLISALGEICDDPAVLAALEADDTKLAKLLDWLRELRARDPDQKFIVFSSFRRAISYLATRLRAAGLAVMELHGGVKADRNEIVSRFADAQAGTILLTSEIGGEGLDLQFCRILINWDLPWNPMKVEQRIGRIDRIGQRSPSIDIINLIAENTIEEQVYDRLYLRLGIIEETLGDFEPILGEIIRDIEFVLVNPALSPEERAREFDRSIHAAEQRKMQAEELEREAPGLVAHGDSILQKVKEAYAPHKRLTESDLRDYIAGILVSTFEGTRLEPINGLDIEAYDIRLSPRAQAEFGLFRNQKARRYPTRFSRDAASGVKAVFGSNPDPLRHRNLEAVPMTHPLARFCAQLLDTRQVGLAPRPVTAYRIPRQPHWPLPAGRYVVAVERWSIDGLLPIDRLAFAGCAFASGASLDEDSVEQMLMESLSSAPQLHRLEPADLSRVASLMEARLLPELKRRRTDFEGAEAARHYDDVATQRALITQHKEREKHRAQMQIRELRASGSAKKMNITYAIEGKLNAFLARMDLKLEQINRKENDLSFDEPVLVGIAVIDIGEPRA
ncbi:MULTISPECIES: SNF2-related protein [unclassified Sphingomonas]|jgi:superfamily II DNA or RNA helicase|uniref:SNF2-related protein n=1 Tax=unclassified Sphingomonas TaxID=196159 RepID=UPI0008364063|nr:MULTISPECIES: SNF2-related protein [unclassified Sphingomonas]